MFTLGSNIQFIKEFSKSAQNQKLKSFDIGVAQVSADLRSFLKVYSEAGLGTKTKLGFEEGGGLLQKSDLKKVSPKMTL